MRLPSSLCIPPTPHFPDTRHPLPSTSRHQMAPSLCLSPPDHWGPSLCLQEVSKPSLCLAGPAIPLPLRATCYSSRLSYSSCWAFASFSHFFLLSTYLSFLHSEEDRPACMSAPPPPGGAVLGMAPSPFRPLPLDGVLTLPSALACQVWEIRQSPVGKTWMQGKALWFTLDSATCLSFQTLTPLSPSLRQGSQCRLSMHFQSLAGLASFFSSWFPSQLICLPSDSSAPSRSIQSPSQFHFSS